MNDAVGGGTEGMALTMSAPLRMPESDRTGNPSFKAHNAERASTA